MVCKIGTNETQVINRMQLRTLTPREPIPNVQTTSHERKPDLKVINKHHGPYARAWESDFGKLISDNNQYKPSPPNSRELAVESEYTKVETCSTP